MKNVNMFILKNPYFSEIKKNEYFYIIKTNDPVFSYITFSRNEIDLEGNKIEGEIYNELDFHYYTLNLKIERSKTGAIYIVDYDIDYQLLI